MLEMKTGRSVLNKGNGSFSDPFETLKAGSGMSNCKSTDYESVMGRRLWESRPRRKQKRAFSYGGNEPRSERLGGRGNCMRVDAVHVHDTFLPLALHQKGKYRPASRRHILFMTHRTHSVFSPPHAPEYKYRKRKGNAALSVTECKAVFHIPRNASDKTTPSVKKYLLRSVTVHVPKKIPLTALPQPKQRCDLQIN